jgi:ABC-type nickel/cobalt efflux system permease component RcnA
VPDRISWGALVALGVSGGLVPCESALILLLGAIALGRVGLGLLLLIAFSLGLALVLMGIGAIVLYAKNFLPQRTRDSSRGLLKWFAIASPAVVMVVGLVMTAVSMGWIRPEWAI